MEADAREDRWRRRLSIWRSRAAVHGKVLGQLWSSSILSTAANGLALALVVSRVSQNTFAAYAIAQVIAYLASTWADGGVGGALQLLASQEGRDRARWEAYRAAGFTASWRMVATTALPLAAVVLALHAYSKILNGVPVGALALFGVVGLFQARSGFCSSLLYAVGDFRSYSALQATGTILRFALIAGVVFAEGVGTGLTSLLGCELASSGFGWWLSGYRLRKQRRSAAAGGEPPCDRHRIDREFRAFIRPTVQSQVLASVSVAAGTLAGSFFGGAPTVAVYALFMKLSQMSAVAVGPLVGYAGRRLRLAPDDGARARKIRRLLIGFLIAYSLAAPGAMILYLWMGRWIHHYAFAYPGAFALFLCVNGLGTAWPLLDYMLACWGHAGHRPLASWLSLGKVALLSVLRPTTAEVLFGVDVLAFLAVDGWLLFRLHKVHCQVAQASQKGSEVDSTNAAGAVGAIPLTASFAAIEESANGKDR